MIIKKHFRSKYGVPYERVEELKQKPCEICNEKRDDMVVDHNHKHHGTYRGILCRSCNTKLGWFENRKNEIEKYLEKPSIRELPNIESASHCEERHGKYYARRKIKGKDHHLGTFGTKCGARMKALTFLYNS